MAGVIIETSYDLAAVRHHLDAALAVNPKNTRALKVRASIEIDRNQWDDATQDARPGARDQQGGRRGDRDEGDDRVAARRHQGPTRPSARRRRSRSIRRTPSSTGSSRARRCASTATSRRSSSRRRRSSSSPTSTRRWPAPASATCASAWRRKGSSGSTRRTRATTTTSAPYNTLNLFEQHDPEGLLVPGDEELPDPLPQRREGGARALPRADDGARVRRHGARATASRRRRR